MSEVEEAWAMLAAANNTDNGQVEQPVAKDDAERKRLDVIAQSSEQVIKQRKDQERVAKLQSESLGRFHDAISDQLLQLWTLNALPTLNYDDYETGTADPAELCNDCVPQMLPVKLYLIEPEADDLRAHQMIDSMRRQAQAAEFYVSDNALRYAEEIGLIGSGQRYSPSVAQDRENRNRKGRRGGQLSQYNCLLHACVERFCLLSLDADEREQKLYNRVHRRQLLCTDSGVEENVYFCARHARFHMCDQFCDQATLSRHNERICGLSGRPLISAGWTQFSYNDGTGTRDQTDTLHSSSALRAGGNAGGDMNYDANNSRQQKQLQNGTSAPHGNASMPAVTHAKRRTAHYSEVKIIRDRNGRRRNHVSGSGPRRRGRGRGSVADNGRRAIIARARQAQFVARSSGDAEAALMTPSETAAQLERLVNGNSSRGVAEAPVDNTFGLSAPTPVPGSGAKRRKLKKAQRVKPRLAGSSTRLSLMVPAYLMQQSLKVDHLFNELPLKSQLPQRAEQPRVKPEPVDIDDGAPQPDSPEHSDGEQQQQEGNMRLATDSTKEEDKIKVMENGSDNALITVSFDVRAKIPFAERKNDKYDQQFALDILHEQHLRDERLARFTLSPEHRTYLPNVDLFRQFGERACAIVWRLLASQEREAIEYQKRLACSQHTQSDLHAYRTQQRRSKQVLLCESMRRICDDNVRRAGIGRSLVLDEPLWKIMETYYSLLVIEFYFNLVALPEKLSMHLTADISETIKSQFYFENFVPAIMHLMCDGLTVDGVVILPRDNFLLREWWPTTATLRTLGIADQTMTHLTTTIQAYIAGASSGNVSMRWFEATTLTMEQLVKLRIPGVIPNSHNMTSRQLSRAAARWVVQLFVQKRADRLRSLSQL